jgi:hypothetical protein
MSQSSNWSADDWYNFACIYAVAAGKSAAKKQEYGDRAMELLKKAAKAGYRDAAEMKLGQGSGLASRARRLQETAGQTDIRQRGDEEAVTPPTSPKGVLRGMALIVASWRRGAEEKGQAITNCNAASYRHG